jgi:hypothetical protein
MHNASWMRCGENVINLFYVFNFIFKRWRTQTENQNRSKKVK